MIFILNTRPTTRFLRQPEPVLSEPGLKNPQASKIKKRILLPLKVNRFQNKPQASKIRPLQKVGFLGNNGKIFVLDLFFLIYWKQCGIFSLLELVLSLCEMLVGGVCQNNLYQMVYWDKLA